jgi:hypothetical protein
VSDFNIELISYEEFSSSWEDTTKSTSSTAVPTGTSKPVTTTWEQHWTKLDDGSGRYVIIFNYLLK